MVTREKVGIAEDRWLEEDVVRNEHRLVLAATLGALFMIAFSVIFTVPGLPAEVHEAIVSLPCLPETIARIQVALL